jgi:pSer/pThr/pTyr-binding forkhead associated (FHA) protein
VTHGDGQAAAKGAVRRFRLTLVEGPARGITWQSTGDRCSVGSHHRNDLFVDDPTVYRFHCEIVVDEGIVRVLNLKSRNGTVLDGVAVIEALLRVGSLLRLVNTVVPAAGAALPRSSSGSGWRVLRRRSWRDERG